MPRFVLGKTVTPLDKLQDRARSYKVSGYTDFLDLFPLGFGTLPEKIVYAALSARGIPFYYLNDIRLQIPEIDFDQYYQADFILPTLRIIIEVQGAHWHSMPNVLEEDAFKFALYEQTGWTPLAWWDYEILDDINALFARTPALQQGAITKHDGNVSSELNPMRRTKTDSSQGIRTLNKKRAAKLAYRKKAATVKVKRQKNYGAYKVYGK